MDTTQVMVKMTFDRWFSLVKNFEENLNAFTDEQLERGIAPGKNRGIYLLGHLTAVHDDMLVLLGFGNKLAPELTEPFLKSPDKTTAAIPTAKELRALWTKVNGALTAKINNMQPKDWFEKHTAVSAEDFAKEPHRNKLNIIITRCSHLAYHSGQFILLK